MEFLKWLVGAIVAPAFQTILQGINDARRDGKLEDLGFTRAQLDAAKAEIAQATAARDVAAAVARYDADDLERSLRVRRLLGSPTDL
jgi:hypothetical protein